MRSALARGIGISAGLHAAALGGALGAGLLSAPPAPPDPDGTGMRCTWIGETVAAPEPAPEAPIAPAQTGPRSGQTGPAKASLPAAPAPQPGGEGLPAGACPKPPYPEEAEARGLEGAVRVRVAVGPDGWVAGVTLLESSGSPVLDRAVLDWIPRRWGPFQPMRDAAGRPVPSQFFDKTIRFRLSEP